jgi:hypothetical protein
MAVDPAVNITKIAIRTPNRDSTLDFTSLTPYARRSLTTRSGL